MDKHDSILLLSVMLRCETYLEVMAYQRKQYDRIMASTFRISSFGPIREAACFAAIQTLPPSVVKELEILLHQVIADGFLSLKISLADTVVSSNTIDKWFYVQIRNEK